MLRRFILASSFVVPMIACGSSGESSDSTTQQALTEAAASAEDATATADLCFAGFEACKTAEGADVEACRTDLRACLPDEAHPGPRCGPHRGKGKGHPRGPNGDCDGGARRGPDGLDGGRPPPPPPGELGDGGAAPPRGDHDGPPDGEGGRDGRRPRGERPGGGGRGEPGFCAQVPLPSPADMVACRDALDTCLAGETAREGCFEAHRACTKAAFDAAREAASATAE